MIARVKGILKKFIEKFTQEFAGGGDMKLKDTNGRLGIGGSGRHCRPPSPGNPTLFCHSPPITRDIITHNRSPVKPKGAGGAVGIPSQANSAARTQEDLVSRWRDMGCPPTRTGTFLQSASPRPFRAARRTPKKKGDRAHAAGLPRYPVRLFQALTAAPLRSSGLQQVAYIKNCKSQATFFGFFRLLARQRKIGSLRGGSPYPPRKEPCSRPRQGVSRGGCGDPPR